MLATKSISEDIKFTYDDYLLLPDDGKRYEILEGELLMSPSPKHLHQKVLGRIFQLINEYVERQQLGELIIAPFDVVISPHNVVQPDLLFVSNQNIEKIKSTHFEGTPDLIIEILSSSSLQRDRIIKRKIYARFGLPEYWLVHPEKKYLQILRLQAGTLRQVAEFKANEVLTSPVFPGLEIELKQIFSLKI